MGAARWQRNSPPRRTAPRFDTTPGTSLRAALELSTITSKQSLPPGRSFTRPRAVPVPPAAPRLDGVARRSPGGGSAQPSRLRPPDPMNQGGLLTAKISRKSVPGIEAGQHAVEGILLLAGGAAAAGEFHGHRRGKDSLARGVGRGKGISPRNRISPKPSM